MKALWKALSQRIVNGERDAAALATETVKTVLADAALTREAVTTYITTVLRGMVADRVKPSGKTSRAPAGQGDFGWVDMPARAAYDAMRRNVKRAYAKMARARIEAEILGVIDASGLVVDEYETFGALLSAANVPADLIESLAA